MDTKNQTDALVTKIIVEPPILTITGPVTFNVPDASVGLDGLAEDVRYGEIRRYIELGYQAATILSTSTTLKAVEAELRSIKADVTTDLKDILAKDRDEAAKQSRVLFEEYQLKAATTLARYLDPESKASLPSFLDTAFKTALENFYKQAEGLLSEGDESALGRLATKVIGELDRVLVTVLEQMAAKHALTTMSNLSGRPFEDALEERLHLLTNPMGARVTRTADSQGLIKRLTGDFVIALNPATVFGVDAAIVVEAKKRGPGSQRFSANAIRDALSVARRNRGTQAGLFVVDSASLLPGGIGFQDLTSTDMAVAFNPELGDDTAIAVALRLLHLNLLSTATPGGEELDRAAAHRVVADLKKAVLRLEMIKTHHQAAINDINKAATGTQDVTETISRLLRTLDELLGA